MQEEIIPEEIFSLRLNALLLDKKLTQSRLSESTNIAQSAISKYLTGKALPRFSELIKLSRALGVSADYLLGLSGTSPNPNHTERRIIELETKLNMITSALQSVLDRARY